ncbi:hypothetical protein L211DRAFT_98580 [Terfezia boudieri ATCC MYA-4762]|uniref:Uncharacterized protein n=1 Tax=Terfezia boudieri ATCC MYA-4762 TaxID=1051890 RepID=A0A3N4LYG3_9PEZI|nr:hypothetical protein L211DRAFT_98580 [Terfezia boudieri ATCC MYA-4762]
MDPNILNLARGDKSRSPPRALKKRGRCVFGCRGCALLGGILNHEDVPYSQPNSHQSSSRLPPLITTSSLYLTPQKKSTPPTTTALTTTLHASRRYLVHKFFGGIGAVLYCCWRRGVRHEARVLGLVTQGSVVAQQLNVPIDFNTLLETPD